MRSETHELRQANASLERQVKEGLVSQPLYIYLIRARRASLGGRQSSDGGMHRSNETTVARVVRVLGDSHWSCWNKVGR